MDAEKCIYIRYSKKSTTNFQPNNTNLSSI